MSSSGIPGYDWRSARQDLEDYLTRQYPGQSVDIDYVTFEPNVGRGNLGVYRFRFQIGGRDTTVRNASVDASGSIFIH